MEPHCQELEPNVIALQNDLGLLDSAKKNPIQVASENLDLPIASRKGVRSYLINPISHFMSYKGLSSFF